MIKYIIPEHSSVLLKLDTANVEAEAVKRTYDNIDTLYIVPEDGEINGRPVVKGDVVLIMYGRKNEGKDPIVLHSDELYEYYMQLEEKQKQCYAEKGVIGDECIGSYSCEVGSL